jgi:competence protein ComEC
MNRRMRTLALWWRHPGFRFLIPLVAGILAAESLVFESKFVFPAAGLTVVLLASLPFLYSKPGRSALISLVSMIAIFLSGQSFRSFDISQEALPPDSLFICELLDDASSTERSWKMRARLYSLEGDNLKCKAMLYVQRSIDSSSYRAGDRLLCAGELQPFNRALNPGQFDAAAHFTNIDLDGRLYVDSNNSVLLEGRNHKSLIVRLRAWRKEAIALWREMGIVGEAGAVAAAMVLGDESEFPAELRQAFSDAGVVHVLSVSGMHASIIYVMVSELLKLIIRGARSTVYRALIATLAIWLYAMLSGLSPSVVRASALLSLAMAGLMLGRRNERAGMLAMAASLIFLFQPGMLFRTGFQLSFMAVMGILMLNKLGRLPLNNPRLLWLIELILVSLAAQLLTTPLSLQYFNRFPTWFLLSNLVLVPLATAGLWLCILLLAVSFIPILSTIIAWLAGKSLVLMIFLVKWIAGLPGAVITDVYLGPYSIVITYLLIFLIWYWLNFREARMLKYVVLLGTLLAVPAFHFDWKARSNEGLIIYSVGAWPAIDVFEGRAVFHLNGAPPEKGEHLMRSAFSPNRIRKGSNQVFCLGPGLQDGELRVIHSGDLELSVLLYPGNWVDKLHCDGSTSVLLAGGRRVPDTLVIGESVQTLVLCDTWKKPVVLGSSNLKVFNLKNGALLLRIPEDGLDPELALP